MHRVRIEVDLENNEVFQEEMRNAIRDEVKRIARDTINKEIEKEVERVSNAYLERLFKDTYYDYGKNSFMNKMKQSINAKIEQMFKEQSVPDTINRVAANKLRAIDEMAQQYKRDLDRALTLFNEGAKEKLDKELGTLVKAAFADDIIARLLGGKKND